jgi:hypothetical protein
MGEVRGTVSGGRNEESPAMQGFFFITTPTDAQ